MEEEARALFENMRDMTNDLRKVWEATMGQEKYGASDEPEYTSLSPRDYDRGEAFGNLHEAYKSIISAWESLDEAMKLSMYFEPDEDEVKQMKVALNNIEKKLEAILQRQGVI